MSCLITTVFVAEIHRNRPKLPEAPYVSPQRQHKTATIVTHILHSTMTLLLLRIRKGYSHNMKKSVIWWSRLILLCIPDINLQLLHWFAHLTNVLLQIVFRHYTNITTIVELQKNSKSVEEITSQANVSSSLV